MENSSPAKLGSRDYFAEMYIAGKLADAGWDIYFPHRDKGFDMIISRPDKQTTIIRPVQVKGKYAKDIKTDKVRYGYDGKITAFHEEMVLAMPYFTSKSAAAPTLIAWLPKSRLIPSTRGWRCAPARFSGGSPGPRKSFLKYFDDAGLAALALPNSSTMAPSGEHDIIVLEDC